MSSHEFYDDHESVSPEIELESFRLFDEVQAYLRTAPKVRQQGNVLNCAQVVMKDEYPYNDIETQSCSLAAAYNTQKDVTAVIYELTALVDGDPKQAFTLEFYKGAPFGFVFDDENAHQFEVPPIQAPNPIASALQGATAIWDVSTRSYVVISHDPHDLEYNVDTTYEDYLTMLTWLRGADVPLDVV